MDALEIFCSAFREFCTPEDATILALAGLKEGRTIDC
jgi:hypothetical protein